jgi:hypothetical protein
VPTSEQDANADKVQEGVAAMKAMVSYLVGYGMPMDALIDATRKLYMRAAIVKCGGNITAAAQWVSVHRNTPHNILTAEEKKDAVERAKSGKGI